MDAIFTMPYSEYEVINELKKKIKGGSSFYIPTSRQQKGIDFIIHNNKANKLLRIQVKSSRSYITEPYIRRDGRRTFMYHLWFNNFSERYVLGNADYYIVFGLYAIYEGKKNIKTKKEFWKSIILCFSEKEMFSLLKKIRETKSGKVDPFFDISFNKADHVFAQRGFSKDINVTRFLLDKKLVEIKKKLKILHE